MGLMQVKLIPFGIRVNCVAPGIFPSGMVDLSDPNGKMAAFIKRVPMGRGGKDTVYFKRTP
jgi:NAD(P)-dependent dehydrogenase (short-subunit alcohol dehydrogenase family)